MERPRVLVLTSSYPTPEDPVGGVFVREHALAAAPWADLRVVHLARTRGLAGLRADTDEAAEPPLERVRFPWAPRPWSAAGLLAAALAGYRSARRDGFRPDVLHAHFLPAAIPAAALAAATRTPLVVTEHWSAFMPDDPFVLRPPVRLAARLAFEHAALVLPVSEALERAIAGHGIRARTRVVPNAVDTALFHPGPPRPPGHPRKLLAVALFYPAKGVDLLLDALGLLRERRDDFELELVGDGASRGELERRAARNGLADAVVFRGVLPKTEVAKRMREADLFVLPSRFDNNPVALLEALVSGLPAVATAVGGVTELIADERLLAQPEPESLATRIDEALDRLGCFDRPALAASAAARFGAEAVGRQLGEVYRAVTR